MTKKTFSSIAAMIMIRFQEKQTTIIHFREVWDCCRRGAILMNLITGTEPDNKLFASMLFKALGELEELNLISIHRKNPDQKVSHITITLDGISHNRETEFASQSADKELA